MILIGDRNIGSVSPNTWGTLAASSMDMVNKAYANTGILGLPGIGLKAFGWEWTELDTHQSAGNLGMADGSAQQSSLGGLQKAIIDTRDARGAQGNNFRNVILNMP